MTPSEVRGLSRRPGGVRNLGSKSPRPRDPGWARKRRWNNKPQVMHVTRRFHGVSGVHMGAILQDLLTLAFTKLVEAHRGIGRIELQVEGGGLDRLLLVAGEPREAAREGVG